MNETFEMKLFKSFRKHIILLLVVALVGGGAAGVYKKMTTKLDYGTTFTIAIEKLQSQQQTSGVVIDMTTPDYKIFTKLGNSTENLKRVYKELNIPEDQTTDIKNNIEVIDNGSVITYKVKGQNQQKVLELANSVANNMVELAKELRPDYKINIIDSPDAALTENVLNLKKYCIGGFLGSFLLALFAVYIYDQYKQGK